MLIESSTASLIGVNTAIGRGIRLRTVPAHESALMTTMPDNQTGR
jgi:hypothetical protein